MPNRKLIRPDVQDLKKEIGPRGARRKQVPPEQTNAEEYYYLKQMANKTPMVVVLNNDEELRGWIEWYDRGMIKLNRNEGPNLLIPKHSIRYFFKAAELRGRRRRPTAVAAAGDGDDSDTEAGSEAESDTEES